MPQLRSLRIFSRRCEMKQFLQSLGKAGYVKRIMTRILFTTWEGGGHVAPALAAAQQTRRLGLDVLVLSDEANRAAAEALELPFQAWRRAPNRLSAGSPQDNVRDWAAPTPMAVIEQVCRDVICGPAAAYGADVRETLQGFPADLLVSNELLFGALMGAEAAGAPFCILTGNLWPFPTRDDMPPFGPGMLPAANDFERGTEASIRAALQSIYGLQLPALNQARAALGLPPLADFFAQLAPARKILLSVAQAFDFGADPPPAPFAYIGPMIRDPDWVGREAAALESDTRPLVLISTSTLYQAQEDMLRRCIAAVAGEPVRAIVTLGPALDPAAFGDAPANVTVRASASHDALVPQCAAVISHAGHGTLVRPLLHGVPLVSLPMGRDQLDNAARVAARGAGLTLPQEAAPEAIREALRRVLREPTFRAAAERLGKAIRAEIDGGAKAARLIAETAGAV